MTSLVALFLSIERAEAQANVIDQVIWLVGDEPILLSDVEYQKLRMLSSGQKFEGNPDCLIPEQIAVQKLFLNQAKIDSIKVDETRVDRIVNNWIDNVISQVGSKEKLEEYFNKPLSEIREDERKQVRNNSTVQMMQQKIAMNVKVSPSDIRNFFNTLPKESLPFLPKTVEVQIITLEPKIDLKEEDRIKDRLRRFSEEVNEGKKDFSTLARLYSEDKRTAIQGGEYGFVGKSSLDPSFAEVVFNLSDKNRVSQIIKTEDGYHIVKLIDKKGDLINFRQILLRPQINEKELVDATKALDSVRQVIVDNKVTFEQAAEIYSDDKDSRNSGGLMMNKKVNSPFEGSAFFLLEDLPQDVSKEVVKLEEQACSKPFIYKLRNGKEIVALVRLRATHPEHFANLTDDYQKIKNMALAKKRESVINDWIKRKQKQTPISIRVRYDDCEFRYKGWIQKDK